MAGYEVMSWRGLFLPSKTPPEIVKKIHDGAEAALADATVKAKAQMIGYVPVGSTSDALGKMLRVEIAKWGAVIKSAGLKVN